jgi:hypothetical protein
MEEENSTNEIEALNDSPHHYDQSLLYKMVEKKRLQESGKEVKKPVVIFYVIIILARGLLFK